MNLWCVGRNYAEHAKELGNDVPKEPLIFLKAGSCITTTETIELPSWTAEVHHELEIAFQFGADLSFSRVALALDLTERKWQNQLKSKGHPWTLAKSFTGACPLSRAVELKSLPDWETLKTWDLTLEVNGQIRQKGCGQEMVFDPWALSSYVRSHFPVKPQDWLLTGTPSGVGPLQKDDRLAARWGNFPPQKWIVQKN